MNIGYQVIIVVKLGLNLIRFYVLNFVLYFDNKAIFQCLKYYKSTHNLVIIWEYVSF